MIAPPPVHVPSSPSRGGMARSLRLTAVLALLLPTSACVSTTRSQRTQPATTAAPPPGAQPSTRPAPGATPVPGFFPDFAPPPTLPAPELALGILRQVNVMALAALQGRSACPPEEVAPGKWIVFDCGPQPPPRRAVRLNFATFNTQLPLSIDHRVDGTAGPIRDQGATGTCTAVSLSSTVDNAVRRKGRTETVSALHIWSKYGVPRMGSAGDNTVDEGITLEPRWPYDAAKACRMMREYSDSCSAAYGVPSNSVDPTLQAEQAAADATARYRITAIEQLQSRPGNPTEVAAVLAAGDAVWAAFDVDRTAWKQNARRDGVIPDYVSTQSSGHAVTLDGYRTENNSKWFLVHNSWGPEWGENGYAWISERMVQTALRSAFRVRVADAAQGGTPPPPSGGNGCPAGQVRDAVYGTCSTPCQSGSPPAAGVCLPALPGWGAPPSPPQPGQPPPGGGGGCAQGQAPDLMTGQCTNLCSNGLPAIGGLCLPGQ